MPCYKPIDGYSSAYITANGKQRIVFSPAKSDNPKEIIPIPCGRCIGCRLEKAKEWALRCYHEALLYGENNVFLTLTYATENLPKHNSLDKSDFQKFIRALRKKTGAKIRYYMCGEYGEQCANCHQNKKNCQDDPQCTEWVATMGRPHYHAILFNWKANDAILVNIRNGNRVYTSKFLSGIWEKGTHELGSVTFKSAGYVARYILKKQNGERGRKYYGKRLAPYTQMSLRPGIGKAWYEQNQKDFFPQDFAVLPDGRKTTVPTYYRNLLSKSDPALAEVLRTDRIAKSKINPDNSDERLESREVVKQAQINKLTRNL